MHNPRSAQLALFEAQSQRDRVLLALANNGGAWLAAVRAFAVAIARRTGTVSIDDVREELEREGFPMPADVGCDSRIFGCVLRHADFEATGQQPTRRAARILRSGLGASYITTYRLAPQRRKGKAA